MNSRGNLAKGLSLSLAVFTLWACSSPSTTSPEATPSVEDSETACFSNYVFPLSPSEDFGRDAAGAESEVGGDIEIPSTLPDYATAVQTGLIKASTGGKPAFAIEIDPSVAENPSVQIVYSLRQHCLLDPEPALKAIVVRGVPVTVLDSGFPFDTPGLVGLNAFFQSKSGLYVDLSLAWPTAMAPTVEARMDFLNDWLSRIIR